MVPFSLNQYYHNLSCLCSLSEWSGVFLTKLVLDFIFLYKYCVPVVICLN
jgi:hypothetical protein